MTAFYDLLSDATILPIVVSYACNSSSEQHKLQPILPENELDQRLLVQLEANLKILPNLPAICEHIGLSDVSTSDHFDLLTQSNFRASVPALIISSELDPITTLDQSQELAMAIPGSKLLKVSIVSFNLLGCQAAIRTDRHRMLAPDPPRGGSWVTLQCGEEQVQAPFRNNSTFTLIGFIVPVIPLPRGSGGFAVKAPTISSCPVIQQSGKSITGTKHSDQSKSLCIYDRHKLKLTEEMSIKAQTNAGQCTTKPFKYRRKSYWEYIPMVTV